MSKILQLIPNTTEVKGIALIEDEVTYLPIPCFALRLTIEDEGTEDEWENYEVVGMTYYQAADGPNERWGNRTLIFVDEEENKNYKFLGYSGDA